MRLFVYHQDDPFVSHYVSDWDELKKLPKSLQEAISDCRFVRFTVSFLIIGRNATGQIYKNGKDATIDFL